MNALAIISDQIKPLLVTETGENALLKLHEYNVSQLPVVDGDRYVGLITMDDILTLQHLNDPLILLSLRRPYVHDTSHLYDVMKTAVQYNVRIVPVLATADQSYRGVVTAEGCLRAFATMQSILEEGGVIELSIPVRNFQLSEIARLAEAEGVTILAYYSTIDNEGAQMAVTLKLNTTELANLIATYERFNYEVLGVYQEKQFTEDEQERYEAFMKYLNV